MLKTSSTRETTSERRYPLSIDIFKEAVKEAVTDSLFSPVSLPEKVDVKFKDGFDTACWAYLPPHNIVIGKDIFQKTMLKEGLDLAQQKRYIANHYHHELGHALYTIRDMDTLKKCLGTMGAPFGLYNLFEDAYMEARYRKTAEYNFKWTELENLSFTSRPESLLFALVQAEGDLHFVSKELDAFLEKPLPEELQSSAPALLALKELLPRVHLYYAKIVAVDKSLLLMPILKAWLEEFGVPPEQQSKDSGGGGSNGEDGRGDMETASKLMTNEDFRQEFMADTSSISDSEDTTESTKKGKKTADENSQAVARSGVVLHRTSTPVSQERADSLAHKFMKFFESESRSVSTKAPQRRVSARHFAVGRSPYRKTELVGRAKKNIFFEVDCSGSMSGYHIMEGKLILSALSLLAKKGLVEGHVALSAVVGRKSSWELFKLPMEQSVIDRIQGYAGAEGLENTLKENVKLAKSADYVFVYTDGQICDSPINKEFFHRQGIFTWGLYAGEDNSYLDELLKYFDKAIMRRNAEDLVDAMLAQNK